MRLLLLTLLLLSPLANAIQTSIDCDTPTMREDKTPMAEGEIVSHQFYDLGAFIHESPECAYSYDAAQTFHSYQVVAIDSNGVRSKLSKPVEINLLPPLSPVVEVTIKYMHPAGAVQ